MSVARSTPAPQSTISKSCSATVTLGIVNDVESHVPMASEPDCTSSVDVATGAAMKEKQMDWCTSAVHLVLGFGETKTFYNIKYSQSTNFSWLMGQRKRHRAGRRGRGMAGCTGQKRAEGGSWCTKPRAVGTLRCALLLPYLRFSSGAGEGITCGLVVNSSARSPGCSMAVENGAE